MTKRIAEILKRLDEAYGTEYVCYLNHETPWQLLIAVILSAQCTDASARSVGKKTAAAAFAAAAAQLPVVNPYRIRSCSCLLRLHSALFSVHRGLHYIWLLPRYCRLFFHG